MTSPARDSTAPGRPRFLLGTHQPGWLAHAGVPLFVSDTRLRRYQHLPVAAAPWACDSGGFSELQRHGTWTITPQDYTARLYRYRDEIGHLQWAAPQDWMCEPLIIHGGQVGILRFAGTHLSVAEHQHRTITNYATLRELAPDLPIIPVIQGHTVDEYRRCVDRYWSMLHLDLTSLPLVGVGSVCRRQATGEAAAIISALHTMGLHRLHGFGIKTLGLRHYGHLLTSADSMAWSIDARHRPPRPGCRGHRNCANCLPYALAWRQHVLTSTTPQPTLFDLL